MAINLDNAEGVATIAGATIYTAPAETKTVILGFRISSKDDTVEHLVRAEIGGTQVSPKDMRIDPGGGYELVETSKFIVKAGQSVVVFSDDDTSIDVFLSIAEKT